MRLGLGQLGLSPRDFWAMTPRELLHAGEGRFGPRAQGFSRDALLELMAMFPDGIGADDQDKAGDGDRQWRRDHDER